MARFLFVSGFLIVSSCSGSSTNALNTIQATTDTSNINELNHAAFRLWATNPDSLFILGEEALKRSTDLDYPKGKINSLTILGIGHYEKGEYMQAISHYRQAIQLTKALSNDILEAQIRNNISMPLIALGLYDDALENLLAALALGERLHQPHIVAHAYSNLGMVYHYQKKYDQALTYYQQSKSAYEIIGDSTNTTFLTGNIAHIHLIKKEYKEAWQYYMTSLKQAKQHGNQKGIGNALLSLGAVCLEEGKNLEALDYLFQAKRTLELLGEKTEYLRLLQNLSKCYLLLGERKQALHYALQGYELADHQQQLWYVKEFAETLGELYEQNQNYKLALDYQKTAKNTADSLSNLDTKEQIVRLEEKYKYEKHHQEVDAAYTSRLHRKQIFLYLLVISAIALIIIVILLLRNVKQKKEVNLILKQTNEHIAKQHTLLEKADAFKNHLLSLVAHDIRTPIASLRMILNLINDDFVSMDKKKQLITSSQSEVESLAHFVDNLLLWVMRQVREEKLEKTYFHISAVIQETINLYQQHAKSKQIHLFHQTQEDTKVYADMETIKIILRNLLDNALKFCQAQDQITITSSVDMDTGKIKLSVSDTGNGMDEETKKNLFSPTINKGSNSNFGKGTGLGLMLCQQYLLLNDSTLCVESTPEEGSTFWFLLPISNEKMDRSGFKT